MAMASSILCEALRGQAGLVVYDSLGHVEIGGKNKNDDCYAYNGIEPPGVPSLKGQWKSSAHHQGDSDAQHDQEEA